MNANEVEMHEIYFNMYMDAGYSVADAFLAATADVRQDARIEAGARWFTFADAGMWSN